MDWNIHDAFTGTADSLPAAFRSPVPSRPAAVRIVTHRLPLAAVELARLRAGLLDPVARIEPKYFYDERGCALFEAICRLPEYYLTRTEAAILDRQRFHIAAHLPAATQWVDLGCGDGRKSRSWIEPARVRRYVGVDIARPCLDATVAAMMRSFAAVECLGVTTDLAEPLQLHDLLAESPHPPVFFYPGSSLGNFTADRALELLRMIRSHLEHDGRLLVGIDLVKDRARLEAAYDDARGITAAFNRNVLRVVNRLLGADFAVDGFAHRATYNRAAGRIEMRLVAHRDQTVRIAGQRRRFVAGETILTEYSHKYTIEGFAALLAAAGFAQRRWWTDQRGWFAVFLAGP